jgi:hypothetical protein
MSSLSSIVSKRAHGVLLPALLALAPIVGPEVTAEHEEATTSASAVGSARDEQPSASDGPATSPERVEEARKAGCDMATTALRATRDAKIPYYVGCAFLQQETGGGQNVFGHDPTVFAGAGEVTKAKYLAYKRVRERTGQMQGVGPMQLTWYSYQDRADRLGGAWKPYPNMLVGFRHLAELHHATGSWTAAAHEYNGGGAMAEAYAAEMAGNLEQMREALA